MATILLCSSVVRVHDSQAHRKMCVRKECIGRILKLRELFLSFEIGLNLDSVAVVSAILESISSLEPSLIITEHRCLKLVTVGTDLC